MKIYTQAFGAFSALFGLTSALCQTLQVFSVANSAGSARLDNGSLINIGQPFVGVISSSSGPTIKVGIIPELWSVVKPPVPPNLSNPIFEGDFFQMTVSISELGRKYTLQASTNLIEWESLSSVSGNGYSLFLVDKPKFTAFNYLFYRAVVE